jgi:putative MATE family efflux protein
MLKYLSFDRLFYSTLFSIAGPLALQQLIMSSLNFVDVAMVGQLGEVSVAGVGLANQITFIFMLTLFGITSGSAIFTAQLWGKKDIPSLRKVLGIGLSLSIPIGLLFAGIGLFFPEKVLGIYSTDPAVIAAGGSYLAIVGFGYPVMAVTYTFVAVLRSTGNTRLPMVISVIAISLNAALSFILIFGHLGMPALGVRGAAIATIIARSLEGLTLIFMVYKLKTPAAGKVTELFSFDLSFYKSFLKISSPVMVNEITWALGVTTYNVIYARMGTEAIAAVNIANTIENLAFVAFLALANASAIMVGNQIGAGQDLVAYKYARRFIQLTWAGALLIGLVLLATVVPVLTIYKVSPEVSFNARNILYVMAVALFLKSSNLMFFIGILRSGGDTKFTFLLDTGSIWLIGVPLAYLGAFVLHLPVYLVVLMVMADELFKFINVFIRFSSRKWMNNLTSMPAISGD